MAATKIIELWTARPRRSVPNLYWLCILLPAEAGSDAAAFNEAAVFRRRRESPRNAGQRNHLPILRIITTEILWIITTKAHQPFGAVFEQMFAPM